MQYETPTYTPRGRADRMEIVLHRPRCCVKRFAVGSLYDRFGA
jgi:hypothetical protein